MKLLKKLGIPVLIVGMTICVFSCEKEVFTPNNPTSFEKSGKIDPPPSVDEYEVPPGDTTGVGQT